MRQVLRWRPRRTAIVAAALAAAMLIAAPASAGHRPTGYFSPNGDFFTKIVRDNGIRLEIGSLAFRGRYQLCVVTPDGDRSCKRFRLSDADADGVYADSVRWQRHFPDGGPGRYRVIWRKGGSRLGEVLGFHVRPPIACASFLAKCAAPGAG